MKKLILFLLILASISLTGCKANKLDYDDFIDHKVSSYLNSETLNNNKYILYYYSSESEKSDEIKSEILSFFDGFDTLNYYLLDTLSVESDVSSFGKFEGEPIIYVVSNNQVLESYTGLSDIREFIVSYSNIDFDYDLFEAQHLTSYQEVLDIENDSYILYYYFENCPYCIATKPFMLPWAFSKSVEDIYFMNGASVLNADQIPTELIILNSGTPILVVMSNGEFANEYYSGTEAVKGYIERIADGDIISEEFVLDYSDFADFAISSYDETLTISDAVHLEYFYSPSCSYCNFIKQDMLSFFDSAEDLEYYLIDISEATGNNKIESLTGVPALYIIANNEPVMEYKGTIEIGNFLSEYGQGLIDLSDYE